jgi:tetratricopeptide (TPR) repeat protein
MGVTVLRSIAVSIIFLLVSQSATAQTGDELKRPMWNALEAISYLLPLSLLGREISSEDKLLIEEQVSELLTSSDALAGHGKIREPEFGLLAYSFEKAVGRVQSSFSDERYMDAYFALSDMTQNCVSCHSRLPDASDYLLGQKLFARMNTEMLSPEEIAQLYVATRQFDNALQKFEEFIHGPDSNPIDLDLDGIWIDYLQIGLAVKQDVERVRATLLRFLKNDSLPVYIRGHLRSWLGSLDELADVLKVEPSLERARTIFDDATTMTLVPAGRERAVHDIVASSILRRLLETGRLADPVSVSESYYLLGVIALRTLRLKPAVPEMEFLLASAVRAAPDSEFAERAYLLLEEFSYADYLGFGTGTVPEADGDIRELRELVK